MGATNGGATNGGGTLGRPTLRLVRVLTKKWCATIVAKKGIPLACVRQPLQANHRLKDLFLRKDEMVDGDVDVVEAAAGDVAVDVAVAVGSRSLTRRTRIPRPRTRSARFL